MFINIFGSFHSQKNKNNQDFLFNSSKTKMVLDGCSMGDDFILSHTEVGSRLFATLFSQIEPEKRDNPDMFEKNVKYVFNKLLTLFDSKFGEQDKNKIETLIKFYSFTILVCFELDDGFVVKTMGDGYIITVNREGQVSYLKLDYDNSPPYYIYNCIKMDNVKNNIKYDTYRFSKENFLNVGVATDGISAFANEFSIPIPEISKMDTYLLNNDNLPEDRASVRITAMVNKNKTHFFDDTTLII